ncbi:MAG: hypothetical protein HY704_01075 [Gemmatimonadetes bacterium]|nr:hypothetical protein [Gemmatimonadota bacterium]
MRVPRLEALAAAGLLAVSACSCAGASKRLPRDWPARLAAARSKVVGAWTSIRYDSPSVGPDSQGELIAVRDDSLFLLGAAGLVALPTQSIALTTIVVREGEGAGYASTPPLAVFDHPSPHSWERLARYARFPQGLPAQVDRSSLRSR